MNVAPASTANTNGVPTSATRSSSRDQFLKLFLTQLQYQNPLEPMQDKDFLTQLAQFTQVENAEEMARTLQQLQTLLASTQATALIGKQVAALRQGETTLTQGRVSAVRFTADGVWLVVDSKEVRLQDVLQVSG
ncbi:MAG: flagellar hook capping FlgD N-terminal domain-containing protein [Armatimonadota bacterium]|nr:hypothetical protein [bacterium]MCS7310639.1 hypothetical protein [Armatimonadota bacterium]MDW8105228.1 flagellar hook capping FlgD N-terminal domain-containing protein [Armatimonadota bacterium]MDW8290557.1 flagellar hook capping FlgD N-terminal domain-containing protein [Armatimonadota bacterium]